MANKYDYIQQLIRFWQEYEESTINPEFQQFGEWLRVCLHNEDMAVKELEGEEIALSNQHIGEDAATIPVKQEIMNLISRLDRLQDFYVKKFFDGLPINSLLEFSFLFSINKNISLKKKEIIGLHLVEYSTGIDILKRLIKLQLVAESQDQNG